MDLPVRCVDVGLHVPAPGGKHPSRKLKTYELIYVREGRLSIQEGGVEYELNAGQTLLLMPNRKHGGVKPYAPGLAYYWVYFTLRRDPDADAGVLTVPQLGSVTRPDYVVTWLHRLIDEKDQGGLGYMGDLTLLRLLSEITLVPDKGIAAHTTSILASQADMIIRKEYATADLSTSVVARRLGCSTAYLGRVFRRVYGMSVVEAIHERRIREARYLLTASTLNIEEISRTCGFMDSGYFRRLFRRHEGMTPFRYQRAHRHIDPYAD
jgi:AraC-like DNA-binding protein